MLLKLHSQNAAGLIFLRCCPPYLKLHFELPELTNIQKNPSKQTKPQRAPNHTAPGLKSPAFSAHSEEESTERCQKTIFCYISGSDSARAAPLQTCVEVCFALMGTEKPCRVVRAKCPKNRGRRVYTVH